MDLFSKRVLGVEFDFPKLRVAELQLGEPLKLLQVAELDYNFFGEEELRRLLKGKFRARNVIMAVPLNSATHQAESFPLSEQELRQIMPSEARKISMLEADDLAFDYQVLGRSRQQAQSQLEVLVVTASRTELQDRVAFFQEGGFHLKKATTIPVAVLNSIRLQSHRWGEETLLSIHVGHKSTSLLVAQQGKLLFAVEAALDLKDFQGNETAALPRLSAEIKRSIIYFNQRFRGSKIERIVLSGQGNLRELTGPLLQSFGLEVELLEGEGWIDITGVRMEGQAEEDARGFLPSLAAVLGAVSRHASSLSIDLSKGLKGGKKGRAEVSSVGLELGKAPLAAGALALLLAAGGYFYYDRTLTGVRRQLAEVTSQVGQLQSRLNQEQAARAEQQQAEQRAAAFRSIASSGPLLSAVFKSISLAITEHMKLSALQVQRGSDTWEVLFQGEVLGENVAVTSQEFSAFMQALAGNPLIRKHEHRKPIETVSTGAPGYTAAAEGSALIPAAAPAAPATKLLFDIKLVVSPSWP